jgi:deoxyadenosine/deoxycytidine kinase
MSHLIAVIGNTGIGKTSLVRALRSVYPFSVGLEEHTQRPFQVLFKTDARYALANQFDYLLLRAEQERDLRHAPEVGLVDGGLDQDFQGFTRLFRARGYLDSAEFDLCQRLYTTIRASQPLPDLVIFLTAELGTIRQRLAGRDRINIASAEDLTLLDSYLTQWLASLALEQVLRLDVSTVSPDYAELVPNLLSQIKAKLGLDAGSYDTGYIP